MLLILGLAGLFLLPAPWNVIVVCIAALVEVGEVFLWIKFLSRYRVRTGVEALIGAEADVIEDCDPDGRAKLGGEIWNATADDPARPLASGTRARIRAVDGLTLRLAAAAD